jgi:hypothetical protein
MYYAPSSRTPERTIGRSKPHFVERCAAARSWQEGLPGLGRGGPMPPRCLISPGRMLIGSNLPAIVGLNGEACDIREQIQDCEQRPRLWNQCRGLIPECPLLQDHPAVHWLLLGRGYRTLPRTGRRLEREDCALRDVGSDRARSGQEPLPREV